MGLRKDFLIHKQKTIESFGIVRADISGINRRIEHAKDTLASIELRLSSVEKEILYLKDSVKSLVAEMSVQKSGNLNFQSKISDKINSILTENQDLIRKLNSQSLENKKFINRKIKITKSANLKLEKMIKSQHRRIAQLNRKIEGRKIIKKIAVKKKVIKKTSPRKTIKKTITPKKVVTETITPKTRTVTEIRK